jgi:microcystin-dependent protein
MAAPFVAEIRPWACNFAPLGWAFCQGQLLPISQYTALFSLIGTYYGGNGTTTFQLPDLQGRVPMKFGTDPTGNNYAIGEEAGTETITISSTQMPVHTHTFSGTNANSGHARPADGASLGTNPQGTFFYGPSSGSTTTINVGTVSLYSGGNQAHTNLEPFLAINWCIALQGIYPSRN